MRARMLAKEVLKFIDGRQRGVSFAASSRVNRLAFDSGRSLAGGGAALAMRLSELAESDAEELSGAAHGINLTGC